MCLENTPDFEHKWREKCLEQLCKNVTILITTTLNGTSICIKIFGEITDLTTTSKRYIFHFDFLNLSV